MVDPGDSGPVTEALREAGRTLTDILITHHHADHTGGVAGLLRAFPQARVVGPASELKRIPSLTLGVREGEEVAVAGRTARVIEVPGHTQGHIAFFFPQGEEGDLFSGDTLFGGSIGYLFEGSPAQMFASMQKLRALPGGARIWCAHEYTRTTLAEALGLDPGNPALAARLRAFDGRSGAARCTVPLSLAEEWATNPFFRWDEPALCARLGTRPGLPTFQHLCKMG